MLAKAGGLARALAIILSVVAAFVAIPNLDVALVLVILGLISGVIYADEMLSVLLLSILALPLVGSALGNVPAIGEQLGALANNVALSAAGAAATAIAIRLFNVVKGDVGGLGK